MKDNKTHWYEEWFNQSYLELYPHRDEKEAQAQISFILDHCRHLTSLKITDALDVACGAGRHVEQLSQAGIKTIGIDLSETLVNLAKKRVLAKNLRAQIVQGDMRHLPFADSSFDLVISMFTSFGYFAEDSTNELALQEWRRVLKPEAILFIDYLNRERTIDQLIPSTTREIGNKTVTEIRSITKDKLRVEKEIIISDGESEQRFYESVRMFSNEELVKMIARNGFAVVDLFGDFNKSPYTPNSERQLIFAKAK